MNLALLLHYEYIWVDFIVLTLTSKKSITKNIKYHCIICRLILQYVLYEELCSFWIFPIITQVLYIVNWYVLLVFDILSKYISHLVSIKFIKYLDDINVDVYIDWYIYFYFFLLLSAFKLYFTYIYFVVHTSILALYVG